MEGTKNKQTQIAIISEKGDDLHGWLKCIEWKMRETPGLWKAAQTAPMESEVKSEDPNLENLQAKAMGIIIAHTGGMIRTEIMRLDSPFEAWAHIQALNKDTTGIESCLALGNLVNVKETGDLGDYLRRFIQCRSRCIELQWDLDDKFYGVLLVNNLSVDYNPIRSLLLGKGKSLTFTEARDSLYAEETSNRSREAEDDARKTVETPSSVQCYNCLSTGHRSRNCPKPKVKCGFPPCGKMGHHESVCYAKNGHPTTRNGGDSANATEYINSNYDGFDLCCISDVNCAYLNH